MKHGLASFRRQHRICALIGVIVLSGCVDTAKDDNTAFLEEVRTTVAKIDEPTSEAGNQPGTTEDPDAVPAIEVATTNFDLGVIPTTEMGHGELKVKNVGKAVLVVSEIKTSCGCTQGKIVDNTIPPGGETVIDVLVDPKRIYGFDSTKSLTIFSNDPKQASVEVRVHAAIKPEFVLEPEQLDFDVLEKGETAEQTAIMRQNTDEPLTLLNAQLQGQVSNWLDVSFEETPEDQWKEAGKREYAIHVSVKPTAPAGPLAAQVLLQPDLARIKRYYLPVKANIKAFYSMSPQVGNFGPVVPGKTVENVLRISSDRPFSIVSATADPPTVTLSAHKEGVGNTMALDATIGDDIPAGTYSGSAQIVIADDGKEYTEKVRLVGVVQSSQPMNPVAPASQALRPVTPAPAPPVAGAGG